jgi:hypothetical protein
LDSKLLESASKRSTNLGNGVSVVKASAWQQIGSWFVDFGVVAVGAAVAYAVVAGSEAGTTGMAVGTALATWWGAAWVYGFCCARGRSLGSLASGTGIVRFATGTSPGFWRAGWVMFSRIVLFPIVGLVLIIAAVGGGNPSMTGPKPRHITVDLRFPQLPG